MNFVIAAGGTGGHLFPGVAVGEVLLARDHRVMLLISEKEIDELATADRSDFRIERIPGAGLPRIFSPAMFGFFVRFGSALARCRSLYRDFKPDAVLGMGGFTSTAPIVAGRFRKIPTFLHESNAIPGKANRLNARLVNRVLLGFEACRRYFPKAQCVVTGTPIRASLAKAIPREDALKRFGFTADRRTLLVMGGSQGAHGINSTAIQVLLKLQGIPLQVIHLAGSQDAAEVRDAYARAGIPAFVAAFHHRMQEAYSVADLAIARSGAASVTELTHFAIPSLLIPYPFAAEDHQTLNASIAEQAGAAILIAEAECDEEALASKLRELLSDTARLAAMSAASANLNQRDSAEKVADAILRPIQRDRI